MNVTQVFRTYPAECATWVALSTASATVTRLMAHQNSVLAAGWTIVNLGISLYLILAATWLGLGRSSFQVPTARQVWRVILASSGSLLALFPIIAALLAFIAVGVSLGRKLPDATDLRSQLIVFSPVMVAIGYALARMAFAPFLVLDRDARPMEAIQGTMALSRHQVLPLLALLVGPMALAIAAGQVLPEGSERFLAELATSALGLASMVAIGGRYLATPAKERQGSVLWDPAVVLIFVIVLACIPIAAVLGHR